MQSKDSGQKTLASWRPTSELLDRIDAVVRLEGFKSRNDFMLVVLDKAARAACAKHGIDPDSIVPLKAVA